MKNDKKDTGDKHSSLTTSSTSTTRRWKCHHLSRTNSNVTLNEQITKKAKAQYKHYTIQQNIPLLVQYIEIRLQQFLNCYSVQWLDDQLLPLLTHEVLSSLDQQSLLPFLVLDHEFLQCEWNQQGIPMMIAAIGILFDCFTLI